MTLGLVSGTISAVHKDPALKGITLLIIQELDLTLTPNGIGYIAADCVGAGRGDLVAVCKGTPVLHTEQTEGRPIDAAIVAIIDKVEIE